MNHFGENAKTSRAIMAVASSLYFPLVVRDVGDADLDLPAVRIREQMNVSKSDPVAPSAWNHVCDGSVTPALPRPRLADVVTGGVDGCHAQLNPAVRRSDDGVDRAGGPGEVLGEYAAQKMHACGFSQPQKAKSDSKNLTARSRY
jgi:hypothetical protein